MSELEDLLAHQQRTRKRHVVAMAMVHVALERDDVLTAAQCEHVFAVARLEAQSCSRELVTTARAIAMRCAGVGARRLVSRRNKPGLPAAAILAGGLHSSETLPPACLERTSSSATEAILTRLAREDLRRTIEQLHALGWRLTTAGGDTVDRLALIHLTTGERMPVWTEGSEER